MTPTRGLIALGLLALSVASCNRSSERNATAAAGTPAAPVREGTRVQFDASSPQLERIRVVPVTTATLAVDQFDLPGTVEAMPTRLAKLALPVSGRVRQVMVTLGDHVRNGQTLLTMDTPESSTLQSTLRQAQADVRHRQAAVAKAEADRARVRDLLENRAIAQKEVITAEASLAEATAALEQARATEDDVTRRLQLLGVDVRQSGGLAALRSPMDGEVVELAVAPGEYRSDTAAPVMTVADLSRIWVVASVPERELGRVQTGQQVRITVSAFVDQPFEGRVARVAAALDPETRTGRAIAELENPRRLLHPQMFARVRFAGPARNVVTVPVGAVVQDERRTSVFVERARGQFERCDVSLGPRHADTVVVTSGLAAGDRVVVDGTMLLMGQ
jgi:cobalt-zinc-cadmium efflux system membrane fusion protein